MWGILFLRVWGGSLFDWSICKPLSTSGSCQKESSLPNCWYVCLSAYFNFLISPVTHTCTHIHVQRLHSKADQRWPGRWWVSPFRLSARPQQPQTLWYTSSENELLSVKGKALWDQLLLWRCMAVLSDVSTLCLNHTRPCAELSCILNHPLGNWNFSLDLLEGFLGNSFLKKKAPKGRDTSLHLEVSPSYTHSIEIPSDSWNCSFWRCGHCYRGGLGAPYAQILRF